MSRRVRRLLLLCAALLLAFLLSLMAGKVWVAPWRMLAGSPEAWIMGELRLPRAILGLLIGGGLGIAGAALQGYSRNPLADPSILGISSSAALGAVAAIFLGWGASSLAVAGGAMAAAFGAVLLLGLIAGTSASAVAFILAGTVLSSLAGALTALLISLAPTPFATSEIITWLMGALTDRGWREVAFVAPCVAVGSLIFAATARDLDALTLGEVAARSLGIDLGRLQFRLALALALTVGASVAATGVVGFVGLIVPHLMRPLFGARPSGLLLPSALGGAVLLLTADALVRLVPGAAELRLGIAMSLIGAPFFFALLLRFRREMA